MDRGVNAPSRDRSHGVVRGLDLSEYRLDFRCGAESGARLNLWGLEGTF